MSDKFTVNEAAGLLAFLHIHLHQWARTKVKQRLQTGCVRVNGITITQHNFLLNLGDDVEVGAAATIQSQQQTKLDIIYIDNDLIAINKPAGLLSVGTTKETQLHALALLRKQLSHKSKAVKLWPVHRIDRDTSGVLLFATSSNMREALMSIWDKTEKTYLAIVEGHPTPAQGTIDQPLRLDETEYRMHVGEHPNAKSAITHYQTERTSLTRSLLQVKIETGRQHQIRAHMAWLGTPIVGDQRYGTEGSRMGLHASQLKIVKPYSHQILNFETPTPTAFLSLLI